VPKVRFHSPFDDLEIEVPEGSTLLEAAENCGAHVGHSCGGVCACSTCHVYVRKGLESLSEQEDAEMDRLDMAFDVRPHSRLSCQSRVGTDDVDVQVTEESLQAYLDEDPAERHRLEAEGRWPLKKG
jgi:ferredoxin, 2Fe-2S